MAIHKPAPDDLPDPDADTETLSLFGDSLETAWEAEWKGMPEFVQKDETSWHSLVMHFRNPDDLREFGKLLGQHIGPRPKALWFPAAEIGRYADKRYVDEP